MASIFTFPADVLSGATEEDENFLNLNISRQIENEADYVGIYLSAAAGYDPEGALSLKEVEAHVYHDYITGSGDEDASYWFDSPPYWLQDHPPEGERYTQLRKAVEQIKLKQQEGLPVLPEFLD
jgi:predicted Zn-dependent protease